MEHPTSGGKSFERALPIRLMFSFHLLSIQEKMSHQHPEGNGIMVSKSFPLPVSVTMMPPQLEAPYTLSGSFKKSPIPLPEDTPVEDAEV